MTDVDLILPCLNEAAALPWVLGRLPAYADLQKRSRRGPKELLRQLPPGTAFVDLLRYVRLEPNADRPGRATPDQRHINPNE